MKVLICHSRYASTTPSGENRVVEEETRLLGDAGHQVTLWAPSPEGTRGLSLVRTGIDAVWSRRAESDVRRWIRQAGYDVVHVHNLFPSLSPAVLRAAREEGAAVVMTLHNYRLLCLPATFLRNGRACEDCLGKLPWRGVWHRCYRNSVPASAALATSLATHRGLHTFDRVHLFLAVSEFVREKHLKAGMLPERIRVKPNFARSGERRAGPGDYFLFLGRLSSEKGADTVVGAWRGTRGRLLVVGDGDDAARLRSSAPSGVEFRPSVPSSDVPELMRGARALLVPSRCYEGSPRAVLEAYASGVPVIASRIGALPEIVDDGTSGLLAPPDDPAAWAAAADRVLDDGEAERLGEGAWRLWQARFTPERALRNLESAYAAALAAARS